MKQPHKIGSLLLLSCVALLIPTSAQAYTFWKAGVLSGGPQNPALDLWIVRCNDGHTVVMPLGLDPGGVMYLAESQYCVNHGGITNITDSSVTTALDNIAGPSSWVLGESLGNGSYRAVTLPELEFLSLNAGPSGSEFAGFEVLSLNVGGTELLPNAIPLQSVLPLLEIYSNEDGTGPVVGGPVPVPEPSTALLLGLGLAVLGLRQRIRS